MKPVAKRPVSGAKKSVAKAKRPAPKEEPLAKAGNAAGDWRSKVDPEDWNQMPASQREPAQFQADKGVDPDDFITGIRLFVEKHP